MGTVIHPGNPPSGFNSRSVEREIGVSRDVISWLCISGEFPQYLLDESLQVLLQTCTQQGRVQPKLRPITIMDQNWQSNVDMSGTQQARYGQNTAQQHSRNYSGSSQQQQPRAGFTSYQTPTIPSHPQSSAASPASTPHLKHEYTGDGDVAMEDADPYNRMKYPSRPSHSHRVSSQYLAQEDSAAAKRYSPMKTLSPSSPYAASPQQPNHSAYSAYAPQSASARQSPTRTNVHGSSASQSYYQSPGKSDESTGTPYNGC